MKYQITNNYTLKEIEGKSFLIPTDKAAVKYKMMIYLNASGVDVYNALSVPRTVDEVTDILFDKYDMDKSVIKKDVRKWVSGMSKNGSIHRVLCC